MRTWSSLPDAPSSVQPPTQAERLPAFVNKASSPLTLGVVTLTTGVMRPTELGYVIPGPQPSLTARYQVPFTPEKSSAFLGKYLDPPSPTQYPRYSASTSSSFMGRASYAASRIFVTRDDSGKGRLNTRYVLGLLTSVASATAHRPYWARSTSETFNNFGSTIGSDAGMNVFDEFGPGIRRMMKGLTPKFLSGMEKRINHSPIPKDATSGPALLPGDKAHLLTETIQ
ncbi:MAG: hypothetical protein WBV60_05945 [Terriglobales bacterium]